MVNTATINGKSVLNGKYQAKLMSFQKPKMFVCQQKQQNNCLVCCQPSAINGRLVHPARDRVGRNGLKIEKC